MPALSDNSKKWLLGGLIVVLLGETTFLASQNGWLAGSFPTITIPTITVPDTSYTIPNPDTDGDGLLDTEETMYGTDPANPDTDGDHLPDGMEVSIGTDPTEADTDGGSVDDATELSAGTDPTDATDDVATTTTLTCTGFNIDPDSILVTSTDGIAEDVDFTVTVESADSATASNWGRNLMAFSFTETAGVWYGIVDISTRGSGSFSNDVNGNTGSDILVAVSGPSSVINAVYSGGAVGDVITATVVDESDCTDTLTLTELPDLSGSHGSLTEIVTDTDTDGDGLTDAEEDSYGTDPNDTDSDDDELTDYEEVMTYHTDPLDSDTDNGGITDGTEVENNTDPLDSSDDQDLRDAIIDSPTCSDPFTDTDGHWAEYFVCRLYKAEVVIGRTHTLYYPNSNITRAEWLKIILLNSGLTVDDADGLREDFADVSSSDWYYPYVALGEDLDVIRTRDFGTTLRPNDYITRGDAILWAVRLAGKTSYDYSIDFSDVNEDSYYAYAIAIASETTIEVDGEEQSIVEGYSNGTFRPENYIARSEAATMAMRIHKAWYSDSSN